MDKSVGVEGNLEGCVTIVIKIAFIVAHGELINWV